jgi:hypothetical protein
MKLVLIKPPKRRAKAWGTAGQIVGTVIGSLPVKARPGKNKATAAKVAAPAGAVIAALAAVLVLKRRRSKAPAPDSWSAPSQDHGTSATVGAPSAGTPPMPQPQAGPTTLTEREKAETIGSVEIPEPASEAAVETAPAAASETPASDVGKGAA